LRTPARTRSIRAILPLAASVLAVMATTAPAANAGALANTAVSCSTYTFQNPFTPWFDYNAYTLAPSGSLETSSWSTDWKLSGTAKRVAGNESYFVHAKSDAYSLSLPPGSSATTRAMCTTLDYPSFRFFMRNTGASTSTLKVEVLFEDLAGSVHSLQIANLAGKSTWQPSSSILFLMNVLSIANKNGTSPVAFRFTPQGSGGNWQIDDVYVDPYKRR
jgi:hypothetical protein